MASSQIAMANRKYISRVQQSTTICYEHLCETSSKDPADVAAFGLRTVVASNAYLANKFLGGDVPCPMHSEF